MPETVADRDTRDDELCTSTASRIRIDTRAQKSCTRKSCRRDAGWWVRIGPDMLQLCTRHAARRIRNQEWREKVRAGREMAAGLHRLAELVAANPDLASLFRYTLAHISVPLIASEDPKTALAAIVRAGLRTGATVSKLPSDQFAGADVLWGPVGIHVYADRELVCERVVTGTETVTRTVPEPAALAAVPTVEVTEEVERVEWVCRPLLEAGADR
jgi:hypothetical protein